MTGVGEQRERQIELRLGGTGNRVRISGYEAWTIDADGLIAESQGHYDQTEYDRQLEHKVEESR